MDVIAWLGAYYVDCAVYEQAIQFFERAAMIQPKEVRWPLMVASCHRRSGNYQTAYEVYKRTHGSFPNDVECLRFLVRICTDLGVKDVEEYQARLRKAENAVLETGAAAAPSQSESGAAGDAVGASLAAAPSSSSLRSANRLQDQVHQGSAGSGASGRVRKAVKFDLGEACVLT
ncbi:MAG: putative intraflagellar transport protein IFT88 [Olpidium bornovanus]|uniref:Intraflagellar transport protein IFT88 n=1 Tax=Olpidium bornovanus TaxID=278681 RepID=A0A8H7ZV92_9FUNG|nr:MAG: putative intraflagellar transport protein IFT88 [Olpidium bornovanus]